MSSPSPASPASPVSAAALSAHEPARAVPTAAVQRSRWLAFGSAALLALLCLGWELAWAPTGRGTLAIKALPLLIALPGLWRLRLYTYRWLSLAVWLYVTEGAVRATSEAGTGSALAWTEVALSGVLFTACAWQVRARLAAGRASAPGA
ncbi:MAG: DUF2069 domain-containing protein [Leptothrix sp. (in: b-proteobacteria)]